ncbi:MAG TPA: DUF2304 domain-containing protein [Kofleriaceae bacterium]|jgi:hypothetical protein
MEPNQDWMIGKGSWVFAIACLLIAAVMMRLLLRERVTLQGSMSYLAFLMVLGAIGLFPNHASQLANYLGFKLLSNFLFCAAIAMLALLHLRALVTLSKVQLRSVALTQELALLSEKLDRVEQRQSASRNAE